MFFLETIDAGTLDLLVKLQRSSEFSNLRLVGGTALALQIGHRKSVDLDLFGTITADEFEISEQLNNIGKVSVLKNTKNIGIYLINGIKTDIVNYHYKWLDDPITDGTIILAGLKDIAAMKLAAITGRGTKKDFIDLYFLLKVFSLDRILDFYSQKFNDGSLFLVLKSLLYFDDADTDQDPVMLIDEPWLTMKDSIKTTVNTYLKTNTNLI
jgi:hypothetical protein